MSRKLSSRLNDSRFWLWCNLVVYLDVHHQSDVWLAMVHVSGLSLSNPGVFQKLLFDFA